MKGLTMITIALMALSLALLASCGGNDDNNDSLHIAVTDITDVDREAVVGDEITLTGRVIPEDATNKAITWAVKNAGNTGAKITNQNKLSAGTAGTVVVTATVAKGASSSKSYTKDFNITFEAIDALAVSFEVITNGGDDKNLIRGNSLAWIKDAKKGSKVVFYISTTVYPDASGADFKPKAGDTIVVIGNSTDNQIEVNIPVGTTPGSGRSILLEIPIDEALTLIGNASSLKVDVKYGRINACQLMEPRRYKVPHSPNAKRMMNYFRDIYGKKMVSGQMDISWEDSAASNDQIPIVYNATGKYPALKGFDWLEIKRGALDNQQAEEAVKWWQGFDRQNREWVDLGFNKPGIVNFCWHWRGADNGYYGNTTDSPQTTLKVPMENGKLNKSHANFAYIKDDLDLIIGKFKWMNEQAGEDIPVLWRPLHEAGGNWGRNPWFWWGFATDGSSGNEAFKALWEYMYDYMTIVNGLTNLIWVCNPQGDTMNNWVPDLRTVDITGYDPYVANHESQKLFYKGCKDMDPTGNTMVAMTENGRIPDPDLCVEDDALWLYFMIWDRMFTQQNGSGPGSKAYEYFNHERVVSLDTLPDLKTYRLE